MAYIDDILLEFKGQISIQDIYNMTYKEIGYLKKHRRKVMESLTDSQKLGLAMQ